MLQSKRDSSGMLLSVRIVCRSLSRQSVRSQAFRVLNCRSEVVFCGNAQRSIDGCLRSSTPAQKYRSRPSFPIARTSFETSLHQSESLVGLSCTQVDLG